VLLLRAVLRACPSRQRLDTINKEEWPVSEWTTLKVLNLLYWLLLFALGVAMAFNRIPANTSRWNLLLGLMVGSIIGYAVAIRWGGFNPAVEIPACSSCLELCAYMAIALGIVGLARLTTLGLEAYVAAAAGAVAQYLLDDGQL
jgi:hypothetical protein